MPQDDKLEPLYAELHDAMRYDAMSLRALALLLNKHKKNRDFMKFASAELGRNARHMARAVDYFESTFILADFDDILPADDYLKLFAYASLKKELCFQCYKDWGGLTLPLHIIRERVQAAKPKRERKQSLAERVAEELANLDCLDVVEAANCARNIACIPEVKHVLERKP